VTSERTVNLLRAAALQDNEYQLLKKQDLQGWSNPPSPLKPTVGGDFVSEGNCVIALTGARDEILALLHTNHTGVNGCLRRP
jgi:hypothetical protein